MWFADTDELRITNVLQMLNSATGLDNHVSTSMDILYIYNYTMYLWQYVCVYSEEIVSFVHPK